MDKQKIPILLAIAVAILWGLIQVAPYFAEITRFPPYVVGLIFGMVFVVSVRIVIRVLC